MTFSDALAAYHFAVVLSLTVVELVSTKGVKVCK